MTRSEISKASKQMSLLEDFHASHSRLQEKEKAEMTTDTSGMKLLELLPKQNRNGLLEKMLKVLLTSPKVRSCDRYKKIWKPRISKSNVLLFQLLASVHGIKEKEFGLLPTPVVSDHLHNQSETIENWKKRAKEKKKQGINLHFALRHHVQMYPTPSASNAMDVAMPTKYVKRNKTGWTVTRKGTGTTFGAKLNDVVHKLYPTPTARDYKDTNYNPITCKRKINQQSIPTVVLKDNRHGGKLNPNFVEMLMAYPTNWTKIEQTELKHSGTQSFPKSSTKSEKQLRKPKSIFTNQKETDRAIQAAIDQAELFKQTK